MKAKDVMERDVITIEENETIVKAINLMKRHKISGLPVVDKHGNLVGIVTDGDILRALDVPLSDSGIVSPPPFDIIEAVIKAKMEEWDVERALEAWKTGRVKDIMSKNVVYASPDTPVEELADLMLSRGINRIPIVEKGKVVGIVTRLDLLKAFK